MKLIFTGDINFRGIDGLDIEKCREIVSEVKPYFEKCDFSIVNLETPLADKEKYSPIYKSGPNLISSPENIAFLKALGVDACTLANNHIGDYGEGAVLDTVALLSENGILCCGAGKNTESAYNAVRLEKDGVSVSLISVCENEFGMATEESTGSAGYNPRLLLNKIKEEKAKSSYVIVVFHGGNEFNPLPSPDTQERYRLICDMGADAIIGGHTHCPEGYEIYGGKPIFYSMGNFLFKSTTEREENNSWYYGYMPVLELSESVVAFEIIPYKFNTSATKISVFSGENKEKMLEYIEKISKIIEDKKLLDAYFGGWAYLHMWIPSAPNNISDLSDYNAAGHYNLISCEAHNSQAKRLLRAFFEKDVENIKKYSEKISELSRMPV